MTKGFCLFPPHVFLICSLLLTFAAIHICGCYSQLCSRGNGQTLGPQAGLEYREAGLLDYKS